MSGSDKALTLYNSSRAARVTGFPEKCCAQSFSFEATNKLLGSLIPALKHWFSILENRQNSWAEV
jgi:hypothetical protein